MSFKPKKTNSSFRFMCLLGCTKCCQLSNGFVFLTEEEASRIAEFLSISENDFIQTYTNISKGKLCLRDGENQACIFLKDGKCGIYFVRPMQCRTYPFWPENIKSPARWKLTATECPGIGKGRVFSDEEIRRIGQGQSLDSER